MLPLKEKQAIFAQLTAAVRREFQIVLAAQQATQAGATHEEARPENDKDTRALEQTYLARGQAERVAALRSELEQMKSFVVRAFSAESPIGLGALLRSEDDEGEAQLYLLAPAGAGEILTCELGAVRVVTPRSPLGRALVGARLGDDIEIRTPSGKRTLSITSLC